MEQTIPGEFRIPQYRHRRFQNWIIIGFLYSLFYMTRYNLAANASSLMTTFGWSKQDYGIFEFILPLVYGLAVVINGPIADKFGGRRASLIGCAGVVVMNFLFGAASFLIKSPAVWDGKTLITDPTLALGFSKGSLLWTLAIIWAINGYFQAFGALSIVKINASWFHIRERGTFGAIFGILIRFGLILSFSITPLITVWFNSWVYAFWIPATLVLIFFFLTYFFVRDTPIQAGYPDLDTGDGSGSYEPNVKMSEVLRKVFTNKVMWMIGIGSMMIGFVRRSIVDAWYPIYFKEILNVPNTAAAYQITAWGIAVVGIIGGFVFGIMSDKVFKGRRPPAIALCFLGMILIMILFYCGEFFGLGVYYDVIMITLLSFFVNGAHGMIGGAVSMDFGGKKAAATAAGLIDGFQYLAGAFVGLAVGYIVQNFGWALWKIWAVPFAAIGAILMFILWNATPNKKSSH